MEMPASMLLQIFAACPAPAAPAWMMFLPIARRSSSARAKPACVPPTMKVSVPAAAPPTPPETGASRVTRPFSFSIAWKAAHDSTSFVEQSMTSAPGANGSALAGITASTWRPLGSIVITTSAPATASSTDARRCSPASCARSMAPVFTSKQRTSCPASFKRHAMGKPMLPSPMNPITAMWVSLNEPGSGHVEEHRLLVGEVVQHGFQRSLAAHAGLLHAALGQAGLDDDVLVDLHEAGVQSAVGLPEGVCVAVPHG